MVNGKIHELIKDDVEGKKSLNRMILIITLIILCGFWVKSLATGLNITVPPSLMQAFWTSMSYQGIKLGITKLVPNSKGNSSGGGTNGS